MKTIVQAQVPSEIHRTADEVLRAAGLTASDFICMVMASIADKKSVPLDVFHPYASAMKVRVSEAGRQDLTPAQISAYLRGKGAKDTGAAGKAVIWIYKGAKLFVPLSAHYADYAVRLSELLSQLEEAEGRSQLAIFDDIRNSAQS